MKYNRSEMKMFAIRRVSAHHEPYDPSASGTGGSYFQPRGIVWVEVFHGWRQPLCRRMMKVIIVDESCGDYGERVDVTIDRCGFIYGDMEDRYIWEPDEIRDRMRKISRRYRVDIYPIIIESIRAVRRESVAIWEAEE